MILSNLSVLLEELEPNQKLKSISILDFFNSKFSVLEPRFQKQGYLLPVITLKYND